MIYSDAFLQLPDKLKQRVYSRLARILMGGGGPEYAAIDPAERRRIVVILQAKVSSSKWPQSWADWRRSKPNLSSGEQCHHFREVGGTLSRCGQIIIDELRAPDDLRYR